MRIGRNEIIEELTEHIRKSGGEPGGNRGQTERSLDSIKQGEKVSSPRFPPSSLS